MVVFDSTMMLFLIRPDVNAPIDKKTGLPVDHVEARINARIEKLEKEKVKIIIPTPSLSELLVRAGSDMSQIMQTIQKNAVFRIASFNTLAAIEVAVMTRQALDKGDKRSGTDSSWAKVKYDRQIIAIAKVHGADTIYSDDENLEKFAKRVNIKVIKLSDLPVPNKERQQSLFEILEKNSKEVAYKELANQGKIENDGKEKEE